MAAYDGERASRVNDDCRVLPKCVPWSCYWPVWVSFFAHHRQLSCVSQQGASGHEQISQGEQGVQPGGILGQAAVAYFGKAELPLDHPKRVFHLSAQ